ncbi:hypothetical protein T440DRAFT_391575 [Plenodomus tracheiphilus IPT5]|uniref:Uncharacterized protein n=1 Tax=Plenodomus tracheiphilus IPT5 TaxID=1408161 RepID=A0A6A7BBP8_9PLEO|nr:hypothetical protein T440DRAFT_391575 [Plenodomus tracheiphilus IPT5]
MSINSHFYASHSPSLQHHFPVRHFLQKHRFHHRIISLLCRTSTIPEMAPATTKTATPKAASTAGVKKAPGRPKGSSKKAGARTAMVKMQAYFKENRSKYSKLDFKEQQKELGKDWKASSENPKNAAA